MDELLKKLLSGSGKLSLLLLEAKAIVEASGDKNLLAFIDNELNGYTSEELPSYRNIKCEITGTVQTPFGHIQENILLQLSEINKLVEMDLTVLHLPDNIGFIEQSVESLNSSTVTRNLHDGQVEMLNQLVSDSNPGATLLSAAYSFNIAALKNIPNRVREKLIEKLQQLNQRPTNQSDSRKGDTASDEAKKIKVFVTYAWENDEHNERVMSFTDFLRKKGYDAFMDRMKSEDESAIDFNKMMITGIQDADKVVIVLSPRYKEKADNFHGGVGTEYRVILEEIKTKVNKFIFVSFGSHSIGEISPTGNGGREVLDLKRDQDENSFNSLFAKLQSKTTIKFSDVSDARTEVVEKKIKPFKL